MPIVTLEGYQCTRCKGVWYPLGGINKKKKPKVCPKCKSPYWDKQKYRFL